MSINQIMSKRFSDDELAAQVAKKYWPELPVIRRDGGEIREGSKSSDFQVFSASGRVSYVSREHFKSLERRPHVGIRRDLDGSSRLVPSAGCYPDGRYRDASEIPAPCEV